MDSPPEEKKKEYSSDAEYFLDLAEEFAVEGDGAKSNLFLMMAMDADEG
jgi:hypothetical protein